MNTELIARSSLIWPGHGRHRAAPAQAGEAGSDAFDDVLIPLMREGVRA